VLHGLGPIAVTGETAATGLTTTRLPATGTAVTDRGAATAIGGLGVALVVVASTGAVPVELLGPDVVLASAGFLLTHRLLAGANGLGATYGRQFLLRTPLLFAVPAVAVGLAALTRTPRPAAQAGADAVFSAAGVKNWWDLVSVRPSFGPMLEQLGLGADWYVEHPDRVDPLGVFWLVALLIQLGLVWPLLLALLRAPVRRRPAVLGPVLLLVAVVAAAVGPLRALAGAGQPELAWGTHVRAAEWLVGAAAAAFAVARPARRLSWAWAWTSLGVALLAGTSVLAAVRPQDWLPFGGPGAAAAGTAALLLAVTRWPRLPLATALNRGLPLELGRVAYPLLLLHLTVFWCVQAVAPEARPFALLAVGGALAWLLSLLLQDGLVRRAAARPAVTTAVVILLAVAVGLGGTAVVRDARHPAGTGPAVLVLGGTEAADLAAAIAGSGRYSVVDGTLPGCGLLPARVPVTAVRTSVDGQLPAPPGPVCGDGSRRWATLVAGVAPAAIVVDLAVDADPHSTAACDAGFRATYRPLLDAAVAAWTAGAPDRPVLVADGPAGTRSGRCLDALITETVAARAALVPLPVQALLCPSGADSGGASCDGSGSIPIDAGRRVAVARVVDDAVAAELGPARTAARKQELADDCGGVDDAGVGDAAC
jgi:peptidoglycan/LPS O-acetylase OafA/YrhL